MTGPGISGAGMTWIGWMPWALPFVAGVALALSDAFRKDARAMIPVAATCLIVAAAVAGILAVRAQPFFLTEHLHLDTLSFATAAALAFGGALCCVLVWVGGAPMTTTAQLSGGAQTQPTDSPAIAGGAQSTALMALATGGALVVVAASSLVSLFIGIELMSLAAYALVTMHRERAGAAEAGAKYYLLGSFASALLLFGMALLYAATGSLTFATIHSALDGSSVSAAVWGLAILGSVFVIAGLAFKVGVAPFHMWVPDAYQGAHPVVTAFMSSVLKAAAVVAALRLLDVCFADTLLANPETGWPWLAAALALLSVVLGSIGALAQRDIQRLIAYSSVAHAGFLFACLAALPSSPSQVHGAITGYLAAYIFGTIGLFAALVAINAERDKQLAWNIDALRGLARRQPATAIALTIALLSLMGLPPTAGFFAKLAVLRALLASSLTLTLVLAVAVAIGTLIGVGYYLRVVVVLFDYRSDDAGREPPTSTTKPQETAQSVAALCAGALVIGPLFL